MPNHDIYLPQWCLLFLKTYEGGSLFILSSWGNLYPSTPWCEGSSERTQAPKAFPIQSSLKRMLKEGLKALINVVIHTIWPITSICWHVGEKKKQYNSSPKSYFSLDPHYFSPVLIPQFKWVYRTHSHLCTAVITIKVKHPEMYLLSSAKQKWAVIS